jgi:hypothetical protein
VPRINSDSEFARYLEKKIQNRADNDNIVRNAPDGSALARLRDFAYHIEARRGVAFPEAFAIALSEHPKLYDRYLSESGKGC